MKNSNRAAIEAAQNEMNQWRNDSGSTFYPQDWEQDMGGRVYHDPGRKAVEVSLPHILNIAIAGGVSSTVNLFAAARNYNAVNFGNAGAVTVTYTSNNPLVPFTYGDLLGTTLASPIQVGLIRIQAITQAQATSTLSVLRNPGVGKFAGESLFPLVYPNQFISTITYVENAFKADAITGLSYTQNGATDAAIQMYFYANASTNLGRAFSNEKVVQEYVKPQTGISQNLTISAAQTPGAGALRSQSLL